VVFQTGFNKKYQEKPGYFYSSFCQGDREILSSIIFQYLI
jgi:hypothetical protein